MRFGIENLSKRLIALLVRKKSAGNIVTVSGGAVALLALTLPAFLKLYAESTSYISSFEYVYMFASAGIGSFVVAAAVIATAAAGGAAVIAGPSRVTEAVALLVLIGDVLAIWSLRLPFGLIGFGTWLAAAGLAAVVAGCFVRR